MIDSIKLCYTCSHLYTIMYMSNELDIGFWHYEEYDDVRASTSVSTPIH